MTKAEESFKNNEKKNKNSNTFYKTILMYIVHTMCSLYLLTFIFKLIKYL